MRTLVLIVICSLLLGCGISTGSSLSFPGMNSFQGSVVGSQGKILRKDRILMTEGTTLSFTYDVTVKNGSISIGVRESGVGGQKVADFDIKSSGKKTVSTKIAKTGTYSIVVTLWGFGGDYNISWQQE